MIRTFHSKIDPVILFGCMLPCTVLAVYFFWIKLALLAAVFMIFMVIYALDEIASVELHRPSFFFLFKRRDAVLLTLKNGRQVVVTPFPAAEFCHALLKRREDFLNKQQG